MNGYLPTTGLGGASVTLNGKAACLNYVSPTQIHAQASADSAIGTVTATVTTSAGVSSASVPQRAVMPDPLTGSNYVLAVRAGDGLLIDGTGAAVPSFTTAAAARPGISLEIFATGPGATATPVAPGLVFSGAYSTTSTPEVTIGGTAAPGSYCGLIGAGWYQINLTVPGGLSAGTYCVVVTQTEVSSPTTATQKVAANQTERPNST